MMNIHFEAMPDGTYLASVMTEFGSVFLGYVKKDEVFDSAEVEAYVAKVVAQRKAEANAVEAPEVEDAGALWKALMG